MNPELFSIPISAEIGSVSAELAVPEKMKAVIVLAHGAGANMNHRFMVTLSAALSANHIGAMRYNFPYMEQGKKRPDVPVVAHKAVATVVQKTYELFPDTNLFVAGKSFGGRMSSQYLSIKTPEFVKGIIFYGFPLHPAGEPSITRAEHLKKIKIPMLFLQGTRDALAEKELIKNVCENLSTATLAMFEGADHSFKSGKKEVIEDLADRTNQWIDKLV